MKPIIYGAVFLLLIGTTACNRSASTDNPVQPGSQSAMGQGNPQRMHRFGRILQTLNLTDAQKDQIRTIMTNARAKGKTEDPETRRATMKDAMAQIDTVLTPAQRTEWHQKLQAMRQQQGSMQQQGSSQAPDASQSPASQ